MEPVPVNVPVLSLYGSIAQAETGAYDNPWIRTKYAPKGGSSAFGPVQITGTKAKDYASRNLLSKESQKFVNDFYGPLTDKFLKYGKEPNIPGYNPAYDYGGSGEFPEERKNDYLRLADEMLTYDYISSNGDIDAFIKKWRGTGDDERYNTVVRRMLEHIKSK